jgi:metal-responsive CopG/Arc/MetJ family transcriptional regulator
MVDTPSPSSSLVKLTVNVVRNLYQKLERVASRRGVTVTEALQEALAVYTFIDETLENGEQFFIADHQGRLRQVFFDRISQEAPPASRAITITEALKKCMESRRWPKT